METEELTRLVDGIYKNILDKFNPGARQLINAGKAYLKALHGAAAASRVYVDALSRLARQAQLGTWGGSQDVGSALMRIVEVYKEIQEQEMNILKAFYVDLLVPLETNLEKDTKVVQSEQKKFLQQHKTRSETYSKAVATMKKQRKKSRGASKSGLAMDKELKNMQILEEEKSKLDAFCEQSLKNAMTQERRRYGFVLERQCSLAKHYASFHEVALAALHPSVDEWREVAATREYLPQSVEDMFASRLRQVSFWPDDEENGGSELTMSSQLRKTRSMDSSCLELRLGPPPGNPPNIAHQNAPAHVPAVLSRARSEANIHASTLSLGPEVPETPPRPRSMAPASRNSGGNSTGIVSGGWSDAPLARALFAYLSSGENQLSFLEGDLIALMGDRQKGWQFGENLRTQSSGWFPLAYTEIIIDDTLGSPNHGSNGERAGELRVIPPCKPPPSRPPPGIDDLSVNHSTTGNNTSSNNSGTPTNMPNNNSHNVAATPTARQPKAIRPSGTLPSVLAGGRRVQPPVPPVPPPQAVTSLHSSNDSGFSNEPPVQPDIDYSDDEAMRHRRRKPRERGESKKQPQQQQQQQQHQHQQQNHQQPPQQQQHHQQQQQQQQQQQHTQHQQRENHEKASNKDWENDSWKTIPRDEKSWHLYRTAMDIWAEVKLQSNQSNEKNEDTGRYSSTDNNRRQEQRKNEDRRNIREYSDRNTMNSSKRENSAEKSRKSEYARPNPRAKQQFPEQQSRNSRRDEEQRRENSKREREVEESEDEVELEDDDEEETYGNAGVYTEKKYYEQERQEQHHPRYRAEPEEEKSSSATSDSDEESTITIPETGRKVEHIAQKLEQTAQRYAREHSPPKFVERRNDYKSLERRGEKQQAGSYDKSWPEGRGQREYFEKATPAANYERTFEKNPERNRNVERASSRRFERPRPPSVDAPERPTFYRERRYSDKEEAIYGETGRFSRDHSTIEKERGYESNFETKLERTKVLERHGYDDKPVPAVPRKVEKNDSNNNTLKNENRKPLLPRQSTAVGHLIQTGRNFDSDSKSPKLVKRTKSFWRFRRDSDVLEGMALWQHRSLVDIPKMIKRESMDHTEEEYRKSSPNGTQNSHDTLEKRNSDTTITNEPKPAERMHIPEKAGEYFEEYPTPAERPKATERSEYRMHREERSFFVGNVSRKAILENERKRSLEAKRNMIVAELKENNEAKRGGAGGRRKKVYGDDDDGLIQNFTETELSDEESTYSCIVVKDQAVAEKTLLPRTKLRRESEREKNTCGPWYDLWGADASVNKKPKKKKQQ